MNRLELAIQRGAAIRAMHAACPDIPMIEIARRLRVDNGTVRYHLGCGRRPAKCRKLEEIPTWEPALVEMCAALSSNRIYPAIAALVKVRRELETQIRQSSAA